MSDKNNIEDYTPTVIDSSTETDNYLEKITGLKFLDGASRYVADAWRLVEHMNAQVSANAHGFYFRGPIMKPIGFDTIGMPPEIECWYVSIYSKGNCIPLTYDTNPALAICKAVVALYGEYVESLDRCDQRFAMGIPNAKKISIRKMDEVVMGLFPAVDAKVAELREKYNV